MAHSENILTARGLHKSFGGGEARVHVLRGVDLAVRRGEFLAVMGPSGSGKSTLLHLLGLMAMPDEGVIQLAGRAVGHGDAERTELRRRAIGFVFQRFNLLSVLSAADNIAISLRVRGLRVDEGVHELLRQMGVAHLRSRKPGRMSIGEQQRVAVARAMAHRPAILLADEPTGNLDSQNAASLMGLFRAMNREHEQTVVMITHSPEAAAAADRVVYMKDGRLTEHT